VQDFGADRHLIFRYFLANCLLGICAQPPSHVHQWLIAFDQANCDPRLHATAVALRWISPHILDSNTMKRWRTFLEPIIMTWTRSNTKTGEPHTSIICVWSSIGTLLPYDSVSSERTSNRGSTPTPARNPLEYDEDDQPPVEEVLQRKEADVSIPNIPVPHGTNGEVRPHQLSAVPGVMQYSELGDPDSELCHRRPETLPPRHIYWSWG
jgi:hypothetical protein